MYHLKFYEKLPTINQVTELLINEAIQRSEGDKRAAAKKLGISIRTLGSYLKKNIEKAKYLLLVLIVISFGTASKANADSAYVEGQVVVNFQVNTSQEDIAALMAAYDLRIDEKIPQINYYIFDIIKGYTVSEMVDILREHSIVKKCEPNYYTATKEVPDDSLFHRQWSLENTDNISSDISMIEAWEIESGDSGVIVAIIDMGFDMNHEDLQENIWHNPGEIPNNNLDDDGNGYVDDIVGWDFVDQSSGLDDEDCDWEDEDNDPTSLKSSHGNRVLGVIGATTDNGIGIAGIAGDCRMMLIRCGFYNTEGNQVLSSSSIIKGIIYAVENGASVINISSGSYRFSSSYKAALQYAVDSGVVVVCSAGNEGSESACYPAAYDIAGVISVGASNYKDEKCSFSNWGDWVDVSAPGQYIMTTFLRDAYGETQGTSFSAPIVAGIAALLFSKNPNWTPAQVHDQIMNTVDVSDSLSNASISSGRVNAHRALSSVHEAADNSDQSETTVETPAPVRPVTGGSSGGGCFIDSAAGNTGAIPQLMLLIVAGLIISVCAGMKKYRI